MTLRVGCINYAHKRGLGYLMRDFHRAGVVTDVLVVKHPGIPSCAEEWYPGAPSVQLRRLDRRVMQDFCAGMDAMLFFETPFDWPLIPFCRSRGIRTYLVTMMECTPIHHEPPDCYICPSLLDYNDYFPNLEHKDGRVLRNGVDYGMIGAISKPQRSVFLPLPVEYPWRLRERATHYVHRGGYLGLRGREGTTLLIEAMRHVRSPLRLTISVQENVSDQHQRLCAQDRRIDYTAATIPYEDLYGVGDVAVMPQKFNGVSCPMQEACAAGLLMMASDRFPANSWLPKGPLIPVRGYNRGVQIGGAYNRFDEAVIDPVDIAATMDAWFERDITEYSLKGKAWAEANSWEALKPRWLAALEKS